MVPATCWQNILILITSLSVDFEILHFYVCPTFTGIRTFFLWLVRPIKSVVFFSLQPFRYYILLQRRISRPTVVSLFSTVGRSYTHYLFTWVSFLVFSVIKQATNTMLKSIKCFLIYFIHIYSHYIKFQNVGTDTYFEDYVLG